MKTKAAVRGILRQLPKDCSIEDVQYQRYVLQAADRGRMEIASGMDIPHDKVARELRNKWRLASGR